MWSLHADLDGKAALQAGVGGRVWCCMRCATTVACVHLAGVVIIVELGTPAPGRASPPDPAIKCESDSLSSSSSTSVQACAM
jgi:hypothetical protein